ncbi:MAG TPA: AI-2E family transporter YdiK [Casimicrobiaceae bacterium]|nr:AI-2E family transporter YdiK [Casimicrobiaceae bacterium]
MTTRELAVTVARRDLTRTLLAITLLVVLMAASFWILRPFLLATVWAMTIVVATWPLMLAVQARLRRRALAVTLMSLSMLLVLFVPLLLAIQTVVENTDTIMGWVRALPKATIPPPPDWLAGVPLIGTTIAERWTAVAAAGTAGLASYVAPYAASVAQWLGRALGGIGTFALEALLTIIIATILYTRGEAAREALIRFGRRLAGDRGESVVLLAGRSIRAVALGVVVTALVQTTLAGIGLALAGVPFAGLLTAVILLLCIAQIGPVLVLIPAIVWLFYHASVVTASLFLVWSIIVGALDNVLRPILIRKGADLPLLLIFAGVIGGLVAFGIVGLFIGPVVLAIAYTLLNEWIAEADRS